MPPMTTEYQRRTYGTCPTGLKTLWHPVVLALQALRTCGDTAVVLAKQASTSGRLPGATG